MDNNQTIQLQPKHSSEPEKVAPKKKSKAAVWIIPIVLILLIVCCLIASAAALLYFDPFEWELFGRVSGGYDSVVKTMPFDTQVYFSVDLLKAIDADTSHLIDLIGESSTNPNIGDREAMLQKLDEKMFEKFSVSFTDNVQPWIGQYLGFGINDLAIDAQGEFAYSSWLLAAESRSKREAEDFVTTLVGQNEQQKGITFSQQNYKDTDIFEAEILNPEERFAVAQSNGYVYIGSSAQSIMDALDALDDASLYINGLYQESMQKLPKDKLVNGFINQGTFARITETLFKDSSSLVNPFHAAQGLGVALGTNKQGVQVDYAMNYDPELLPDSFGTVLSLDSSNGQIADHFPTNTVILNADNHLDLKWQGMKAMLSYDNAVGDIGSVLNTISPLLGFNPENALFPLMDGSYAIGLLDQPGGFLEEQLDLSYGVMGIFESSQPQNLQTQIQNMADNLDSLIINVSEKNSGSLTYYEVRALLISGSLASFGYQDELFLIGSNSQNLINAASGGDNLSQNPRFSQSWNAFADDMHPCVYINFEAFLSKQTSSNEIYETLEPVKALTIAKGPYEDHIKLGSLILFME